jgi:hypothetical protein
MSAAERVAATAPMRAAAMERRRKAEALLAAAETLLAGEQRFVGTGVPDDRASALSEQLSVLS